MFRAHSGNTLDDDDRLMMLFTLVINAINDEIYFKLLLFY